MFREYFNIAYGSYQNWCLLFKCLTNKKCDKCHGKLVLPQKEENEAITTTTPFDSSQWASYKCAIDWESHKNSITNRPQKMHYLSNEWSIKWTIHFKDNASSVVNWSCYSYDFLHQFLLLPCCIFGLPVLLNISSNLSVPFPNLSLVYIFVSGFSP